MAMQDLSTYLKKLKDDLGVEKTGELALQLRIAEQRFSRWCNGEEIPDDESCVKIAIMAGDDPAKVLILKHLSSAPIMARDPWEKIYIKYRDGWTGPKPETGDSQFDRRRSVLPFDGTDRRTRNDRRQGLDRRLALAI